MTPTERERVKASLQAYLEHHKITLLWQKRIFVRNFKGLCLKLGIG